MSLVYVAHWAFVDDLATVADARRRSRAYKRTGLVAMSTGAAILLGSALAIDDPRSTEGIVFVGGGLAVFGLGFAISSVGNEYRDAARRPVTITPAGRGIALSGVF